MAAQITLEDVARHAGVSRATVSLVCRSSPLVADNTRERVEAAMAQLGYVYNRGAANLRSSRSRLVGLVLPDLSNPVFAEVVSGVEAACDAEGLHVLVVHSGDSRERQAELLQRLLEMRVDGLIISAATGTTQDDVSAYARSDIPVVQVLRRFAPDVLDYAGTDNHAGIQHATEHMLALGHQRVAFIGNASATSVSHERHEGYLHALREAGIAARPEYSVSCHQNLDDASRTAQALLDLPEPPTALVCFSDVIAFGATLGLYQRGLEPGRDVSVMGFDDVPWARSWRPALSTMAIAPRDIGRAAGGLLLRRIAAPGVEPLSHISDAVLVQRASTASLSS